VNGKVISEGVKGKRRVIKEGGGKTRIVAIGGQGLASVEMFERETGMHTWTALPDMSTERRLGPASCVVGGAKIVEIGYSPEKLRLDRLPKLSQAKICAAIGTNASTVGLPDEQKTYANYETALRASWENGLVPLVDLVADTLRWQLLNEFEDPNQFTLDYDFSQVEALRESQDAKSARTRGEYQDGIITRNEAREALGYTPDPAGDTYIDGSGFAEEPPDPVDLVPPALPPPSVPIAEAA
jgi:hypothetical protein